VLPGRARARISRRKYRDRNQRERIIKPGGQLGPLNICPGPRGHPGTFSSSTPEPSQWWPTRLSQIHPANIASHLLRLAVIVDIPVSSAGSVRVPRPAGRRSALKLWRKLFAFAAQANRAFLGRAVRYLAGEAGMRQFLDIGTGIPTAGNTHQVAQAIAPESRVVYADYDPVVLAHARALLISGEAGATEYIHADLRDTDVILSRAKQLLDFTKPVAVTLIAILHAIPDDDDPHAIVAMLMDAVPPGSYLAVSHGSSDLLDREARDGAGSLADLDELVFGAGEADLEAVRKPSPIPAEPDSWG
jgi:S-adenosyl methyltransferase